MSFSDIFIPRPEALKKDGIEGIIDIENLRDAKKKTIESNPKEFFEITYPTSDIRLVIENLNRRFSKTERTAGLFLLEGYKGSGKSHLELLVYHLLMNPADAKQWLSKHEMVCNLPENVTVIIQKFTDFPLNYLDSLWKFVFEKLGVKILNERLPNLDDLRDALKGKRLVLILDELERGIDSIADENIRAQNLSFLQMLSEEANRTDGASITMFASVYDSGKEPGATLKRIPRIDIKFSDLRDRQRVVLHRLFQNIATVSQKEIETVVQSYVNTWKRLRLNVDEKYIDRLMDSYPFSPELLDMVLFSAKIGDRFQGSRGALGLLGSVVRNVYKKTDLITTAHLNISDTGIRNRISDFDPGQTILSCAGEDLQDLSSLPFAEEIISSVLIATLVSSGHSRGITENELERQVIKPGDDINEYHNSLQALVKFGTYFQKQEDSYFFDEEEKPNAKVEYRSLKIDPSRALEFAFEKWKDQFKEQRTIVFRDTAQVKTGLTLLDGNNLRFVYAPKRLSPAERNEMYYGAENRNLIILLEPKSDTFNALDNADIIKWAQRAIAASELGQSASDSERRNQYERISREDTGYILDTFKRAGLVFIWMQPQPGKNEMEGEVEPLGNAVSCEDVKRYLREEIFPRQRFEEHLSSRLKDVVGKTVREVDIEYKKTMGFPVRVAESTILDTVKNLCKSKILGLRHEKDSACGRYPALNSTELADARITESFEDSRTTGSIFIPEEKPDDVLEISGDSETQGDIVTTIDTPEIAGTLESVQTSFVKTIGNLRQEIAAKLNEYGKVSVKEVQFRIFSAQKGVELGTLPASLRGTISGTGDFDLEIIINKQGDFTKAQVEQMVESLPSFNNAQYKAEVKADVNSGE